VIHSRSSSENRAGAQVAKGFSLHDPEHGQIDRQMFWPLGAKTWSRKLKKEKRNGVSATRSYARSAAADGGCSDKLTGHQSNKDTIVAAGL
jgi:hypothetical protein